MSEAAVQTGTLPPEAQIVEMVMAQFVSRLLYLAATLKLPDHLAAGPSPPKNSPRSPEPIRARSTA